MVKISKLKDLSGMQFGKLTVIKRDKSTISPSGIKRTRWLCVCSCGNKDMLSVMSNNLIRGNTTSCGCEHKRKISLKNKKYNHYELSDEYGVGYTSKGVEFYFDLDDYEKIKDFCWYEDSYGYITTGKSTKLHRVILNVTDSEVVVDHINHNIKDNRKHNMRLVTRLENNRNRMPDKKYGISGVYFRSDNWISQISVKNKNIHLGTFKTLEEAILARLDAEDKYYKEYSYHNSNNDVFNKWLPKED